MKRFVCCVIVFAVTLFACSCQKESDDNVIDFFAMNTFVSIAADGADDALMKKIKKNVLEIEKKFSATYEKSEIASVRSGEPLGDDVYDVLERLYYISQKTDGAFDFTLGSIIRLWNVNGENPRVPSEHEIESALTHCGYGKVKLSDGIYYCEDLSLCLDLGAAIKGYAGQKQTEELKRNGVENAAVNIGGNVSVIGSSKTNRKNGIEGWTVGINNPFDTSELLGSLTVCDSTVSVSGSYERYFECDGTRYHHIFDPKSGAPASSGLVSTAVICNDGMYADALSTALFVMGVEKGMSFYESSEIEFEALFCTEDGTVYMTDGMKELFSPNQNALNQSGEIIVFENKG